ncbi:dynein assembly factor 5, axonemal [Cephus cinctus]|uniref:Dynein assembly factor 5, axonemal n=1 Tax=Cephus cinctus TaxID=211228 RepID=A0AAJ7FFC0_CEPCN|nr:dynein assembly factor 5, axonemal [Cephus cinctus]
MSLIEDLRLNKICVSLQAGDKKRRKEGLEEILNVVSDAQNTLETKNLEKIWEDIHKHIVRILNDQAEACRDLSIEILKKFFECLPVSDKNIIYIIPVLARRLASQELIETSEEVRLNCILLLKLIILKYKEHLPIYLEDLLGILARTVADNYPNVKKESCECISLLAKSIPNYFYSHSDILVKPILSNFTHQHYKVRVASIKTIGDVLQYGNNKSIEEVATPMAVRLFDQSGVVREAVVEVAGHWLLELKDRYSWWHKLIPLLMTGLHDEIEGVRNKATQLWDAVGKKYMEENESDQKFKDKMDFLIDAPEHYPTNVSRPNLGCRVIAQQNLCKLVNGINSELGDWLVDIRIRSAQLLCVLVLNVEQDVTQHIEKLLPAMYRACNDENKGVVENVERAAEYMGYFVPPDIFTHLVLPTLEESPTAGHLTVFAGILRGSPRQLLTMQLEKIGNFLQQAHICQSKKARYQQQILQCCKALLTVCKEDCLEISQELFTTIFTVLSMTVEEGVLKDAEQSLNLLKQIEDLCSLDKLYVYRIRSILVAIQNGCDSWTIHTANYQIFRSCLIRAGSAIAQHMSLVIPILSETMNNDADPELRLKQFISLTDYLLHRNETLSSTENLTEFTNLILERTIVPGLIWSAGRTAEAIRTAAVCCLCALLDSTDFNSNIIKEENNFISKESNIDLFSTKEHFSLLFEKIIPILVSLVDDNAKKTRLYSLQAICLVMHIGHNLLCVTEEHIHQTYPVILKRLDDGCDEVRCAAVKALAVLWSTIPKNYDLVFSKSHVDALYTTAIVHLDDPDSSFQELVLNALIQLAKVHPELLLKKVEKCRPNFRNQAGLERLVEYTQALLMEM